MKILVIIWLILFVVFIVGLIIFAIESMIRRRRINKLKEHGRKLLKDYYNDHPEKVGDAEYFKYQNL